MKYKRTQKRSKQMWQRVEKFSIRKFSFGAASCLIGAITVLGPSSQIAEANGITAYEANGDKVTLYAHGEDVYNLRRTSTSIYNAFRMDVDTSKYTKENPVIRVTLTYNAPDNPNEKAPIFWSGRPFHWFTVPEGTEELGNDNKFSLTNANGTAEFNDWSSWGTNSRFVQGTNVTNLGPFRRKKNNDTTKEKLGIWPRESIDAEFNKVLGLNDDRWYDNSGMPTQDIMKDLRAKSQSIYLDWEKRAAETVTVTYTTKVKDPENTKELTIGMGVYQELNGQQYARVETVKLPVLYKLNELFEPKIPERTGVANPNQLSDDEVKVIKEKIWNANQDNTSTLLPADSNAFQENVKDKTENGVNSIEIDKNTGTATITYKDDTKDVIPGTSLIYQTPDAENPSQGNNGTYIYRVSPYPVGNLNNISLEEIVAGLNKFKEINGIKTDENDVITSVGDGVSTSFIGKKLSPYINKGERYGTISIIEYGKYTGVSIPKDAVFKLKPQFDVDAARAEANKVIDSLANLYPNEQTKYKNQIATATTREAIENVINTAKTTDNENAVALAKMKKAANDKINALGYLTKDEKEAAIAKINSATIKHNDNVDKVSDDTHPDADADRNATQARLDSLVDTLVKKDLEAARTKAKETINGIPDKDLSSDKKTEYITAINNATKVGPVSEEGTILNIVDKAQKEAADALAKRRKEEADKVRQQYKDMIAAIPGLTDEEKKQYGEAIDNATSTDEMASIVEFAKLTGDRKTAVAEIEKLEHLNNNQKQSFKDLVENSANKEDIENYVSQAKQLNSKMKQLHDLVEKAKEIKSQEAYTSATEDKKKVFDQALSDAENVLNKETGTDESISTVENLFKKLETAINNLQPDGEKVKVDVDKSLLKEEYDKGTSVKESPLYKNSTDENGKTAQQRKDEYDKKLVAAKTILNDKDAEQTDVDNALEDLLSAKADLNGKEVEFTLSKKDGAVPISVAPAVGVVVSKPEDQKLIKDKINGIPEGSTVIYNPIQEKGGKTVVPVKVTHENVSKEIEIEVVQSEAAKITPTVSTAKLSEVPTENGTITKAEDVQKVTEAVSVPVPEGQAQPRKDLVDNGKVVQGTDQRANGGANNTGKLVVKVEVTYQDGSKETVEVPVEGTDAAKSPLTPPTKVKVNNPNSLTEEEKTAVADAVKEANPSLKADTNITVSVDGKGKVTVTYPDQSTNTLEAEKTVEAKKDNEKSPLTEPKKVKVNDPNSLTEEEKTAVADAVKEANPSLKADTNITVSVDEKGKVTVTYPDTSTNTLEADKTVEAKKDNEKSPLTEPKKVKVNDPNSLTEEEKTAVVDAVKEANPSLKADTNITVSVDGKGKVTVTYPDQSTNTLEAEKTVEAKKDNEKSPLTEPKKVKVNDPNSLTEEEKTAVADAVKEANPSLKADTNITVSVDGKGKVTVTYPDQSTNTLEAEKTVEAKTKAEQAIPTVTSGGVPVSVDPSNAPKVAEADKKAITEAVEVPKDQPQPKDKQVKNDGEIVEGTGANTGKKVVVVEVTYPDGSKDEIEVPVRKATDKDKAKADLTKAADAEKAEIDEDNALSKKEKEALKAKVDELKATYEEKINNATSPEAIASATEKGRQEIAAVHTPQDITETAKRKLTPPKEKVKVIDINHLTDEEKEAVKKAIVATNPSLEESEVYVSDKGDVASPKGYLEAEKVVIQALNKPAAPVVVADPNHLTNDEKEKVKEAVANANPGLNKEDITVDDKGNVTTKNGDKLLAKDVVTPALKKPATPVVVGNPNDLTTKEKEDIKDAVVAANPGLNKGDVTVNPDGSVTTPKGNLPKEDVVTTVLNKPNKLVEVENPNSLTVKEKEAVKKAVVEANPGLTEDKVKVDDQGNVTTPQGNLPAKDVVTSTLKKPTTPVEVVNPSKLTEPEKSKIVEEIIKNNPDLTDKDIKVDDQGNVETPKGNLPAEDVVTPALKKPTNLVPVKDVNNLSDAEKDAVKDAVVAANPGLNKGDVKVDDQGNVETPRGNLLAGEVVTPALKKPVTPVEVKDPKNLTDAEKDAVKDAVVAANPGLNKDDVKVDGQGNVETPRGNLLAGEVVTPALKKPVTPVEVKDPNNLTDKEKDAVKDAVVAANPGLNKDDVKVDGQGNVETPKGNLPKEDVVVQTAKGQSTSIFKPELDLQTALVSGRVTVEKGKDLTNEEILKQLSLAEGLTPKVISKPTTTETGTKEAEVEVTLADGTKVTVKVPVEVVDSLDTADKDNDLAKAKEDAKKQVEEAAKKKLEEIKNNKDLTEEQKQKAEEAINKAKDEANKAIDEASSAGTAKQIADQAKENIEKYDPKADTEVKKPDVTNLDEEKAKAKAEILEEAQKRIDEIKNNKDLSDEAKQKAIEEINKAKDKAIEDINKGQSKDEINAAKEAGIHKINEVQPEGSIASKFEPKVPENKVEVGNPAKLSDEEREQVRQNIEGANTFPDGTTVEVKPDGTAVITYKDGSSDTISKDKLVEPANKETGTIASRTEPVIPGKTQVGNTTKLTPEEQAAVKKAVEEANNFPAGTTVEVRPDGTVVITYPDKSVDTITGDKLVEKGSKQETPKVQTDAEKNPAQVPGNFVPVENTHNLTQTEQDTVAAKVKEANPAATDVKVSKDGTATLTYGDGSVNTIPGTSLVVAKDTEKEAATQAAQNPAVVPATTTEVGNAHSLTPGEQATVTAKVQAVNPAATDVKVSKDGTATLTYGDGSVNTIPGNQLVAQDPKAQDSTKPTAEKSTVKAPAQRVDVKDITHLTDEEKEKVKVAILQANGSALDGATINVAGDGTATITFPDGSVVTILGKDTVQQSAKGESAIQEQKPEYTPESTPGGDNGGNTGNSDANANAGGGSNAGEPANTGSQTPAQSQASKQLANAKESAKNVIEKAAKDKQDEINGAPLSDKEKAELLARVEAEKQAALKEIENAKTVEDVKEAEMIGVQAIAMVTVPKRPVAPNAAPQATSAPQATAGTMQDVTYQSPAGKQLPNTCSASSAALASLGLVAATSGFALLGRKARRRK